MHAISNIIPNSIFHAYSISVYANLRYYSLSLWIFFSNRSKNEKLSLCLPSVYLSNIHSHHFSWFPFRILGLLIFIQFIVCFYLPSFSRFHSKIQEPNPSNFVGLYVWVCLDPFRRKTSWYTKPVRSERGKGRKERKTSDEAVLLSPLLASVYRFLVSLFYFLNRDGQS